jgi:hypothetical protein
MKTALFWDVTQRVVVIFTDVNGQPIGLIFKGQETKKLNVGPKVVPKRL